MARTYTRKKLVVFSLLEWELLDFMATGRPAQGVIRDALRALAKLDPSFNLAAFERHVNKDVAATLDERQRQTMKGQLEEFRRYLAGTSVNAGPSIDDEIDSAAVFGR